MRQNSHVTNGIRLQYDHAPFSCSNLAFHWIIFIFVAGAFARNAVANTRLEWMFIAKVPQIYSLNIWPPSDWLYALKFRVFLLCAQSTWSWYPAAFVVNIPSLKYDPGSLVSERIALWIATDLEGCRWFGTSYAIWLIGRRAQHSTTLVVTASNI